MIFPKPRRFEGVLGKGDKPAYATGKGDKGAQAPGAGTKVILDSR